MIRFGLFFVAIALGICALSVGPADAATGKLRFWVDRDGDSLYDAGEGVASTSVCRNSKYTSSGNTDSTGSISISGLKRDDTVFCRKLVFSQPATKTQRTSATTNAFDLYLDTDQIDSTGAINPYKISQGEINSYNIGGTVYIRLSHSVFCWKLMFALSWSADNTYKNNLYSGIIEASKYLYDLTDGQMLIQNIELRNNRTEAATDLVWQNADVQVFARLTDPADPTNKKPFVPNSTGAVPGIEFGAGQNLHMHRRWNGSDVSTGEPNTQTWYRCVVHELGHYLLGLKDEYQNGEPSTDNWKTYRKNHKDEVPDNYGFMDHQNDISEMSSFNDYRNSTFYYNYTTGLAIKPKTDVSREIWTYDLSANLPNRPCWLHVYDRFDNRNGLQALWKDGTGKAYGGACAYINLPPTGNFTGRDSKGREQRETQDRDGPTNIAGPYGYPMMVTYNSEWPASASAAPAAKPAAVTQSSPQTSGGPHLINDARITGQPGNVMLYPRVITDGALLAPPAVTISPCFESPTVVPMSLVSPGIYEGSLNIGEATVGGIQVVANTAGGQTTTYNWFQVFSAKAGEEATIASPDNMAQLELPTTALTTDALWVSIGSGNSPIAPTDLSLRNLEETVAFRVQDGVSVQGSGMLNWRIHPNGIHGTDANTTALYRFDPPTKEWQQVTDSATLPGFKSVSASVYQGVFAVLGQESPDHMPPGMIMNLEAYTPSPQDPYFIGNAVDLSWVATGDDGDYGQATRYYVWFNTQPFTDADLSECMELRMLEQPGYGYTHEERSFDLPDPDTMYYFAVQAEDEAGNVGPLSNVVSAKSWVRDTDGDGLPDLWEECHGFDPQTPGEEGLDPDGDGLTNLQEYQLKTNPNDPDTDGDELTDGLEVMAQTSPTNFYDPEIATAGTAKLPDFEGKRVGLQHVVVTTSYDDPPVTYAEEEDSSAGIRLEWIAEPTESLIEVIGMPTTSPNGERCLTGCVYKVKSQASARPMAMCIRSLGGGPFGLQQAIDGGLGLSNIGLLVRTWGSITEIEQPAPPELPTWFKIDDGSGVSVKCALPAGVTVEQGWTWVAVSGISSCENDGGALRRVIRVRKQDDIVAF